MIPALHWNFYHHQIVFQQLLFLPLFCVCQKVHTQILKSAFFTGDQRDSPDFCGETRWISDIYIFYQAGVTKSCKTWRCHHCWWILKREKNGWPDQPVSKQCHWGRTQTHLDHKLSPIPWSFYVSPPSNFLLIVGSIVDLSLLCLSTGRCLTWTCRTAIHSEVH